MIRVRKAIVVSFQIGVVLLYAGCPEGVHLSADTPVEVCLFYPNLQISGGVTKTLIFDQLNALHALAVGADPSVKPKRAELTITSGAGSFAFVDAVRLVMASGDPSSTLPPFIAYECNGDCGPDGN